MIFVGQDGETESFWPTHFQRQPFNAIMCTNVLVNPA